MSVLANNFKLFIQGWLKIAKTVLQQLEMYSNKNDQCNIFPILVQRTEFLQKSERKIIFSDSEGFVLYKHTGASELLELSFRTMKVDYDGTFQAEMTQCHHDINTAAISLMTPT